MEKWKPIPGHPLYEASSLGRIRRTGKCEPLKPDRLKGGYLMYALSHGGVVEKRTGHALVALAFHGPCPEGKEVDHIDFDRSNNAEGNLQYLTHIENAAKSAAAGRYVSGARHWTQLDPSKVRRGDSHGSRLHPESVRRGALNGMAKLSDDDVREIRRERKSRSPTATIAKHGISLSQYYNIIYNKQWRHVK